MPQTQIISTSTDVTVIGTDIEIYTFYNQPPPVVTSAFISQLVQLVGGISFVEGEGGINKTSTPPVFYVNSDGDLVIQASDALSYGIDILTGQLQYTI